MKNNLKNKLGFTQASSLLFVCNDLLIDPTALELPTEIDALIEGAHGKKQLPNGKMKDVVITASDIDAAVSYIKRRREREPNREFVIDYEHQTLTGSEAPAAGWFNDLKKITRDGKAVARAIISKWTPKGAERIKNGEYRYNSPVFAQNVIDPATDRFEQCMLFNIGLTNEPFLKNMMPIAASEFFNNTIIGKESIMDELLRWLISFLNLPITATAEEVLAELNKLSDKIKSAIDAGTVTAKTVLDYLEQNKPADIIAGKNSLSFQQQVIAKLGLESTTTPEQALALIVTAKANSDQLAAVTTELNTLKEQNLQRDFDVVIAKGLETGRILPVQKNDAKWMETQREWAKKDFASFEAYFCKNGPVIGPVGSLPPTESGKKGTGLDDLDLTVAKLSGIDPAIVAKHNAAAK
ncbi:MAG: phage protease [Bacteroidota bacterium]